MATIVIKVLANVIINCLQCLVINFAIFGAAVYKILQLIMGLRECNSTSMFRINELIVILY